MSVCRDLLVLGGFLGMVPSVLLGKTARTVHLNERMVGTISVGVGHTTVLSFPAKPTKVILGNRGMFAVEYVENDVAISALSPSARSNLFVYLEGRRFAFDLIPGGPASDEVVLVRDATNEKNDGRRM